MTQAGIEEGLDRTGPDAREWAALATATGAPPFLRPGWVLRWHEAFGGGRLQAVTARRGGRLVGVLPLQRRGQVWASPTNWHTPGYAAVAEDRETAALLVRTALDASTQRLQLGFVDGGTVALARGLAEARGQGVLARELERSPYLDLEGTYAAYEQQLSRHLRAELRRRRRRLEERGAVRLDVVGEYQAPAFREFLRLEAAGWKGRQGTAVDSEPRTRSFYEDVAAWASRRGWLRLLLLSVGGRAVAGDLALEARGVHYLLKTGYDPEYQRFAPGKLLRRAALERAYAQGATRYEFLGDTQDWKREWTATATPRYLVQVFPRTTRGVVDRAAQVYARPLARAVRARSRQWSSR